MPSFAEIANRTASDFKRPPTVPAGTYLAVVNGLPKEEKMGKGERKMNVASFKLKLISPQEDVSSDALDAFRAEGGELAGKVVNHNIFLDNAAGEDTSYRLTEFLFDHLGIEDGGRTLAEWLNESPNKRCLVKIKHQPDQTGERMTSVVDRTFAV